MPQLHGVPWRLDQPHRLQTSHQSSSVPGGLGTCEIGVEKLGHQFLNITATFGTKFPDCNPPPIQGKFFPLCGPLYEVDHFGKRKKPSAPQPLASEIKDDTHWT